MHRRAYLTGLSAAVGLGAGCSLFASTPERELWSVSVVSTDADPLALSIDVDRPRATTKHPPKLIATFSNPTTTPFELLNTTSILASSRTEQLGLLLVPTAEFDPARESPPCWKPNPMRQGDGPNPVTIAANDSLRTTYEIWLFGESESCLPHGQYIFRQQLTVSSEETYSELWSLTLSVDQLAESTSG